MTDTQFCTHLSRTPKPGVLPRPFLSVKSAQKDPGTSVGSPLRERILLRELAGKQLVTGHSVASGTPGRAEGTDPLRALGHSLSVCSGTQRKCRQTLLCWGDLGLPARPG